MYLVRKCSSTFRYKCIGYGNLVQNSYLGVFVTKIQFKVQILVYLIRKLSSKFKSGCIWYEYLVQSPNLSAFGTEIDFKVQISMYMVRKLSSKFKSGCIWYGNWFQRSKLVYLVWNCSSEFQYRCIWYENCSKFMSGVQVSHVGVFATKNNGIPYIHKGDAGRPLLQILTSYRNVTSLSLFVWFVAKVETLLPSHCNIRRTHECKSLSLQLQSTEV